MKKQKRQNSIYEFRKEEFKKQEIIKGGPDTHRGTETAVQTGG